MAVEEPGCAAVSVGVSVENGPFVEVSADSSEGLHFIRSARQKDLCGRYLLRDLWLLALHFSRCKIFFTKLKNLAVG